MLRLFTFLTAAYLAGVGCTAIADEKHPPMRPIRLALEAVPKTIKAGEVPKFELTIRNQGDAAEDVIDLTAGRRADLQDTYYDVNITQDGKAVEVPRAISDPGPIGEKDCLKLKPGDKATFELTRFAAALDRLPPGKYQARVRFWQRPDQPFTSAFFSPYAEFTVRE
jgi:hypothetical protein